MWYFEVWYKYSLPAEEKKNFTEFNSNVVNVYLI